MSRVPTPAAEVLSELEILQLAGAANSNRETAGRLFISEVRRRWRRIS
jgi:ATP/maltotriose-dependent transcriptional regulator MalT